MRFRALALLAGASFFAAPLEAHHSFAAEFDQNAKIDVTGTIVKVEWMNPHAHFSVSIKDANGKTEVWDFETGSPNALARRGVNRNALKVGDTIRVTGYKAKDHSNLASAGTVTFSDGRSAFAGTSGDGSPGK